MPAVRVLTQASICLDERRMHPVHSTDFKASAIRAVFGILIALLATTSACSVETAAPASPICASFHPARTTSALLNPKLATGIRPLCFHAFAILHSSVTRTPLYVAEHLTRASVEAARALDTRDNRFHAEPQLIPAERGELADYRGSGFDRGHMAPSGDMGNAGDDYESFSLANIVPQDGLLNRNGWANLEGYVRDLTGKLGEAYVVTGPAFASANLKRLNGRVLVPSHVWKAIYVPGQGAGAWIVSNDRQQQWEVVSIATLAARTGIDPFPSLDQAAKAKVPAFPTFD
jgi:endonuclease G